MTFPARRLGPITALAAFPILFLAAPASAHTALTGSDPDDGARIPAPARVTLTFNEAIRSARVVVRPEGAQAQVQKGSATVEGDAVVQKVKTGLPDGRYTIGYRVISADGHPVTGVLSFTVTGPGDGSSTSGAGPAQSSGATPSPQADASGGGGTTRWIMVGAGLAAGAGIGLLFTMRRRRDA